MNEQDKDELSKICGKLDVPRLTDAVMAFPCNYVAVIKPAAQSLQSETKVFMAYLLPAVAILNNKLQHKLASAVQLYVSR